MTPARSTSRSADEGRAPSDEGHGPDLPTLEEAAELPLERVGGKARTLGRLRREGLPVPGGFVIPADALAPLLGPRGDRLGGDEEGDERRLSDALRSGVAAAADALAPSSLAVRSSGAAEDGTAASYAGQFETVLNVRGLDALEDAIHRCCAAARADHLDLYRASRDGDAGKGRPSFAVVLQRMVSADAAGVAFTADPRTGARDGVVVEAVKGLGEALVSGERTPERWRVKDGRARREDGPEEVLDAELAEAVAALARRAEAALDGPQDVEWAVADGEVYLLQSRPITTGAGEVEPVPVEVVPPESGHWFRDTTHFPRPFHPLFASIYIPRYENAVAEGFADFGVLIDGVQIREIGGWPYSRIVPPGDNDGPPPPSWLLWILSRLAPPLRKKMKTAREALEGDRAGEYVDRWWSEWRPELDQWIREADAVDLASLDRNELARHYREAVEMFDRGLRIHFKLFPPFFLAVTDLVFFCRDELGWPKGRATELLAGESAMSSEPGRALEELADAAAENPSVRGVLEEPGSDPVESLRSRAPDFAEEFDAYQERWGLRVLHYDFGTPTFRERPEMIVAFLRNQLERRDGADDGDGASRPVSAQQVADLRERRLTEARDALADRPDALGRFEALVERAHRAYPVREDNEYFALCVLGLCRYAAQEVGRRMVEAGHLERAEDSHFLRHDEVTGWLEQPTDLGEVARRRRGERRWALANPGPPEFGEDPGPPPDPSPLPESGERVLRALLWMVENDLDTEPPESDGIAGVGASPGSYTGPVRIVRSEDEFDRVRGGDVLVCPITSPTWSVLFPSVGALVTDSGGLLSHPAIIAREFGIPAVLATGDATDALEDGQMITVDGEAGRVEPC